MIRQALSASVCWITCSGLVLAADLPARTAPPVFVPPPVAPFTWTGAYIGANAGYHFGSSHTGFTGTDTGPGGLGSALDGGVIPSSGAGTSHGFIGGGQIGYNYQVKDFVFGVEADIDGATGHNTSTTVVPVSPTTPFVTITSSSEQQLDWLGTVRGRIGWAGVEHLLLYGTGGFAFGRSSASFREIAPAGVPPLDASAGSSKSTGYAAGGGVEYAFTNNWSAKVEYLHYDLGTSAATITYSYIPNTSSQTGSTRHEGDMVRVGLNYKFNWVAPAPVVARY